MTYQRSDYEAMIEEIRTTYGGKFTHPLRPTLMKLADVIEQLLSKVKFWKDVAHTRHVINERMIERLRVVAIARETQAKKLKEALEDVEYWKGQASDHDKCRAAKGEEW